MKKFLCFVIFVSIALAVYAEKTITFNKMSNYGGRIFFNVPREIEGNVTVTEYYPFAIQLWGKSLGTGGVSSTSSKTQVFGTPSNTTYTPKELYQIAPNFVKPLMKDLWIEILDDDLTN